MPAAGVVLIIAVLLIVLALVFYLVSVIVALRRITSGLDEVIVGVGEIVEKSAPVNGVVSTINQQLDAGVDLLEGLLVKKAGIDDAVGLVDGLYAGAAAAGLRNSPVIGTDAPVQYEQREDIGAPRKRLPGRTAVATPAAAA
jgi:uncharacterized protein YoxC